MTIHITNQQVQLLTQILFGETTVNRNIGLDFGLFQSRITGTLDFYKIPPEIFYCNLRFLQTLDLPHSGTT